MSRIALEGLLQQAGYGKRKAIALAAVIDQASVPGMSADDQYAAFVRWKLKAGLTDSAVKTMTADTFAQSKQYDALRAALDQMLEDRKTGQNVFEFYNVAQEVKEPPTA